MDKGSIGGIILAMFGIVVGLWMEGGKISQILQPTRGVYVQAVEYLHGVVIGVL